MHRLIQIFGWPHELLHVLALWLVGRRALRVTRTHVDIPEDLSTGAYVFVAGLPALVFWGATLLCMRRLFDSGDAAGIVLWLALTVVCATAAIGTLGDLLLIFGRLVDSLFKPPEDPER